ncbi:hypothetical protein B4589_009505 [Halolamina sp. CBA1230]|uniref:hypothetical protein n=1 Tax=Halolamina sp. CBA1230 TaxID=1853690 RepID=UPI0009A1EDF5|nr:hypothetical protein [Halolamina sp. CBA1230]QKY20601.1 hypothetical protein B4589_009505 [Halolamina sp. CBA1230]
MNPDRTIEATNREVTAKFVGSVAVTALGIGGMKVLPESTVAGVLGFVGLGALLVGIPWMQEAIGRTLLWKNTRGYHADE